MKKTLTLILFAGIISLAAAGCKHGNGHQTEHPTSDHSTSEHPSSEHPQ